MDRSDSRDHTRTALVHIPGPREGDGPVSAAGTSPRPAAGRGGGPRPRTDGFAVATLVSGIVALVPLTAIVGPIALARTARPGSRGRRLAVAGLAAAGLWLVAGALVAAALVAHRPARAASLPRIFGVRTGQCLTSAPNELSGVHVVSCAAPHDAEVFGTFRLAGGPYPGTAALHQAAGDGCASRLGGYLNPQLATPSLTESYVYPDAGAWAAGERTVVCTIRSTAGRLTGSLRGLSG
jgi:hypothetical protein